MNSNPIPKSYDSRATEERWVHFWEEHDFFVADNRSPAPSFCIVMPPPNITGSLHMGHALTTTLQDVVVRWKRMHGFNTLWVPGTDHAGIATQNVIERRLAEQGIHRKDLGREKFEQIVWEWKEKAEKTIHHQIRKMGFGCDWTRVAFTMEPRMSRAVREVFVRLYEEGLIYRGEYMVNWCPRCTTAISDLEAQHEPEQGRLYYLRYPLRDFAGEIVVATTRPETMLGDTAVAVHPDDDRYRDLVGKTAILPLLGRELPVIGDSFVQKEFGTGAVKITPAHDPNDYQAGLRHKLPFVQVIDELGMMTPQAGPYAGLSRAQAREKVLEDLSRQGFLVRQEPHSLSVARCQRCSTAVEPLVSTQWFVKIAALAEPAIQAVESGRIRFVPSNYEKVYFEWMRNIHDWCISRQLWWGHRIPAWYCRQCGQMQVCRTDPALCSRCGAGQLQQDPDVLDTWFSSALWPFSTLGWPEPTRDLEVFYPNSVMMTGFDIIFFWVARMIMMGLHFVGDVPFRTVFLNGLVRTEQKQKMSKSKGNAVDPLEIVEQYGTDAVRFTLSVMAGSGTDIVFSTDRVIGYRAFANKIWNAVRFVLLNLPAGASAVESEEMEALASKGLLTVVNRWVLHRLNVTVGEVNETLEKFRFDEACNALYHFFWHELCDWYLELSKPVLNQRSGADVEQTVKTLIYVLDMSLRALHPVMPFITEDLWQRLPHRGVSLAVARYPVARPAFHNADAESELSRIIDFVTAIRTVRSENNLDPGRRLPLEVMASQDDAGCVERYLGPILALARLSGIRTVEALQEDRTHLRGFSGIGQFALISEEGSDAGAEAERLRKDIARLQQELERQAKKLSSPEFLQKAPAAVVESARERRADLAGKLDKAAAELRRLDGA
ncbi:MAG: valine--tRNA ligase [Acidobacteria bacterium]|nr:valine--tRNA ligase [Acidobacteriota bacterium]